MRYCKIHIKIGGWKHSLCRVKSQIKQQFLCFKGWSNFSPFKHIFFWFSVRWLHRRTQGFNWASETAFSSISLLQLPPPSCGGLCHRCCGPAAGIQWNCSVHGS